MTSDSPQSNPFATRFIAPGTIPWIAGGDTQLDALAQQFLAANSRGAIVGPHGSGKSTLLEYLVPRLGTVVLKRNPQGHAIQLEQAYVSSEQVTRESSREVTSEQAANRQSSSGLETNVTWLQLRKSEPQSLILPLSKLSANDLLILDGYEQLTLTRRFSMVYRTRVRGIGLLVTSHRRTLLPTLCALRVTPEVAIEILRELVSAEDLQHFLNANNKAELAQQLNSKQGNMRELLMDLYDRFEGQRAMLRKTK